MSAKIAALRRGLCSGVVESIVFGHADGFGHAETTSDSSVASS